MQGPPIVAPLHFLPSPLPLPTARGVTGPRRLLLQLQTLGKVAVFSSIIVDLARSGNKCNIASILEQQLERSMGRIGEVGVIK